MNVRLTAGAAVLTAVLAGCGGSDEGGTAPTSPAASSTSASPSASAGPAAFLEDVRTNDFGTANTEPVNDAVWIRLGNQTCQAFQDGSVAFGGQVQAMTESTALPSVTQAEQFIRSAVKNLCPENAGSLP